MRRPRATSDPPRHHRRVVAPIAVDLTPATLRGRWLTLEPIDERHAPSLFEAMRDEEVCARISSLKFTSA